MMDRRIFLQWIGLGSLVAMVPRWLNRQASQGAARAAAATPIPGNLAQASAYTPVGTVSQLDRAGFIANDHTPLGSVMVVRDQANQLKAVSPICPHQGCRVDWQAGLGEFYCPCHGARFAAGGRVLTGPARSDLPTFSTRVEQGNVLVGRSANTASTQTSESRHGSETDDTDDHEQAGSRDREGDDDHDDHDDQHSRGQASGVNA